MKVIRPVSQEEVDEKHPDLMAALNSPDSYYCVWCDGLRVRGHGCPPNEEYTVEKAIELFGRP